jgi:hypothetical protein
MNINSYPEVASAEVERLKKKVAELEIALAKANSILEDNDLAEEPAKVSDEEVICVSEIHKLRVASDNGILTLEDVKVLDLLVKNLLAIRGKSAPDTKESKKRGAKSVAELLSIVGEKK